VTPRELAGDDARATTSVPGIQTAWLHKKLEWLPEIVSYQRPSGNAAGRRPALRSALLWNAAASNAWRIGNYSWQSL